MANAKPAGCESGLPSCMSSTLPVTGRVEVALGEKGTVDERARPYTVQITSPV